MTDLQPPVHVLVVDDSTTMRKIIVRTPRRLGLPLGRIEEAGDGEIALAALRARSFGLAIVDIHMPNLDGLALLDAAARDRVLADLPVVVVSSELGGVRLGALELRGIRFVGKPFTRSQLRDAVVGALGGVS